MRLFEVKVQEVTTEEARLHVRSVHVGREPEPTATFALMLLYDPIKQLVSEDPFLSSAPLAQAMHSGNYLHGAWLQDNARAFIADVELLPGEILVIRPTHPAWISHLREHMTWDTAALSRGPAKPAPPRAPEPVSELTTHSSDPAAGFRSGMMMDASLQVIEALFPLFAPHQYVADPVIEIVREATVVVADAKKVVAKLVQGGAITTVRCSGVGLAEGEAIEITMSGSGTNFVSRRPELGSRSAAMERAIEALTGQPIVLAPIEGPDDLGTLAGLHPVGDERGVRLYGQNDSGWNPRQRIYLFAELRSLGRAWLRGLPVTSGGEP